MDKIIITFSVILAVCFLLVLVLIFYRVFFKCHECSLLGLCKITRTIHDTIPPEINDESIV